jgi:hypothetical protein
MDFNPARVVFCGVYATPFEGWSNDGCHPGALAQSIDFVPFGE